MKIYMSIALPSVIVADYLVNHFLDIHHLLGHLVGPKVLQGEQLWEQIIV